MIRVFLFLVFTSCITVGYTQSAQYQADVDVLFRVLKNTPSYKDQIKGDKEKSYDSLYKAVRNDTLNIQDKFVYFNKLARLFFPFRDNHLGFYQYPAISLAEKDYQDDSLVSMFRQHPAIRNYPRSKLNIDSLRNKLSAEVKDSVQGIYYFDHLFEVGLYRTQKKDSLIGVVLRSSIPQWEKGEIAITLYEYMPGLFRAVYGHPLFKNLILYNNEKIINHSLINSHFYSVNDDFYYKKDTAGRDFSILPASAKLFELKNLPKEIQYLRLGSFQANPEAEKISNAFFQQIKDSLKANALIVDLRENDGGAQRISYKFFTLIREFAKAKKVYVLVNNGTMSQGEIFTLQLRDLSNVFVLGQTTRGTIAYGSNYGRTEKLAGGTIAVYLTDMRDTGNLFRFESIGVEPEVKLSSDRDWIEQTMEFINGGVQSRESGVNSQMQAVYIIS